MSVSRYQYDPSHCDGHVCPGNCDRCPWNEEHREEPQTNGNRIRSMSDYDMADWIADILNHCDNKDRGEDCLESCPLYACCNLPFDNIEAWLKAPVKDGETDA